jgi:hypothetical protein
MIMVGINIILQVDIKVQQLKAPNSEEIQHPDVWDAEAMYTFSKRNHYIHIQQTKQKKIPNTKEDCRLLVNIAQPNDTWTTGSFTFRKHIVW